MLKKSETLLVTATAAVMVLFALIGCDFKVEEYPSENPPVRIIVMADDTPLVDDFLFFNNSQGNATRALEAVVTGGKNNVVITWELTSGDDTVDLLQTQGPLVAIKALAAGEARIKVTAVNPDGEVEMFLDILVGDGGSQEWIFRIYDNGPDGLIEITAGKEQVVVFNEEKIIELRAIGTDGNVSFTVSSESPSVTVYNVQDNFYVISGNAAVNTTITVKAQKGTEPVQEKTFPVKLIKNRPIPPLFWNSTDDPGTALSGGSTMHAIADSPYYFRSRGTVSVTSGSYLLTNGAALIIGGGNSVVGTNPASTNTNASLHAPGQLNLSHDANYRLTIDYRDPYAGGGTTALRVTINNNTTTTANSVLGAPNQLDHFSTVEALETAGPGGRYVRIFNPAALFASATPDGKKSLETAFIGLLTFGGNRLTITGVSLEELGN